jgi:glycosyl transferase family 11
VIAVSLIGGLGNQMFQYAAGKALAERHGVRLSLDLSGFEVSGLGHSPRSFLLDRLNVPEADRPDAASAGAKKAASNFLRALWRQRIDRLLRRANLPQLRGSEKQYREPHFHYDTAFEALGPETSLFGFFQSERYFCAIAETLRLCFSPREPLGPAAAEVLARIERSKLPVSVHIRRGDYLKPVTAEVHGILDQPYYCDALARLEAAGIGREAELFVFSDDATAAEQVLSFAPKSRLVQVSGDAERPWEDMTLMAHCRHHVIANSSFSWWGAWLNRSPDKVVVAPRAWFAAAELSKRNTVDLYPRDWILV